MILNAFNTLSTGLSAIIVQDMSAKRHKDYEFNWQKCFQFEGDTGPFMQYCHARLTSMLAKYSASHNDDPKFALPPKDLGSLDVSRLENSHAFILVQEIAKYPDLIAHLTKGFEACNVLTYFFNLCHRISSAYDVLWVMNRPEEEAYANAFLYWSAKCVLNHGLKLLGLTPLDRM